MKRMSVLSIASISIVLMLVQCEKVNDERWIVYTTANGLAEDQVTSVAIDAQNNKWFGSGQKGVTKLSD